MNRKNMLWIFLILLSFVSCIKDEPLNMEADIVSVNINDDISLLAPIISNNKVVVYLKPGTHDLTKVKIDLSLTAGAVVQPASGSEQDYTQPVVYTVTSEDGKYSKSYEISLVETNDGFIPTEFGFEKYSIHETQKYISFYDVIGNQPFHNWASGNGGYAIVFLADPTIEASIEGYPTTVTKESHSGTYAALLETKMTGALGAMFGKPIAAGNLFIGAFDIEPAFLNPLIATHFGLPFNKKPLALEGYYQYKAGSQVTDSQMRPVQETDSCDIYAVFYNRKELMASDKIDYLTGENILNHPSIVAKARLENGSTTPGNDFIKFSLPFEYFKTIDSSELLELNYSLAIVFSSSKKGDQFQGAVGSKLIIDDVKIITE